MLSCVAVTVIGIEEILCKELHNLGVYDARKSEDIRGMVQFQATPQQLEVVLGYSRIANRVGIVALETKVEELESSVKEFAEGVDWKSWLQAGQTFAARVSKRMGQEIGSLEAEKALGTAIYLAMQAQGLEPKVNLKNPDLTVRLHLGAEGEGLFWFDLVGSVSLHRRGYREFDHHAALKGTIASAMMHDLGSETIADPCTGSATILIEAAWKQLNRRIDFLRTDLTWQRLCGNPEFVLGPGTTSEHESEFKLVGIEKKMANLYGAKRNASIAKVAEYLELHEGMVADHHDKLDVDALIANPPYGKRLADVEYAKTVHEDIIQAANAANVSKIRLITPLRKTVLELCDEFGYVQDWSAPVMQGESLVQIMALKR